MSDLFRSGRGGAGNYHTKDEESKPEDVEAQIEGRSSTSIDDLTRTISATNPPPEYLHTGRGGAGNWIQPKDVQFQGLTQDSNSTQDVSQRDTKSSKPMYRGGRGGAGNYENPEEEKRLKMEQERKRKEEVEKAVERDVESGLARPGRTYGGGQQGGSWEMGDVARS